ncbi:hypothetical protein IH992_24040 [Candidatus Poribacteria bacterium]|nr:hypothetical protein [Candidatus Poribacteria bacterium]
MKTRIQLTDHIINKLMTDLRAVPDETVGEHLAEDQFVDYTMEVLPPAEVNRLDGHLMSCEACRTEVARLIEGDQVWRTEAGIKRLDALTARWLEGPTMSPDPPWWEYLANFLAQINAAWKLTFQTERLAAADSTDAPGNQVLEWRSEDEGGNLILERNGDLIFSFSSTNLDLNGKSAILQVGSTEVPVVWRKWGDTRVVARVVVPSEYRSLEDVRRAFNANLPEIKIGVGDESENR